MIIEYTVQSAIATLYTSAHSVLGHEEITQIEFFGKDMKPMKQVLLVPEDSSRPRHLRNENVVPYPVPGDYKFTRLVIGDGMFGGKEIILVQIFYQTGGTEHHHDHILALND